jgi:hypothetical protein
MLVGVELGNGGARVGFTSTERGAQAAIININKINSRFIRSPFGYRCEI